MIRRSAYWRTTVNRNQNLLGKLVVVLLRHEEYVAALTPEEWRELHEEVTWATERLRVAFAPDHFNYAFLQNQDRHVHLHVIPRYAGSRSLGGVEFEDPDWPDHYRPGVERIVAPDTIDAIARALG
ncbi:MAG: HIT family protein [Gaiellaceae bacterium]